MSTQSRRPNSFVSLVLLASTIVIGAHISAIPLLLAKAGVAPLLFLANGYFAVRIVTPLKIGSNGARAAVGLLLGAATMYMTWAIRIPVYSGWETPLTADPKLIFGAIMERAGSMDISKGLGAGTSTEGPSWLMLGTYMVEAVLFVGVMVLCSMLSGPDAKKPGEGAEDPGHEVALG